MPPHISLLDPDAAADAATAGAEPFDYAGLRRDRGGREVATPALRAYRHWARALAR